MSTKLNLFALIHTCSYIIVFPVITHSNFSFRLGAGSQDGSRDNQQDKGEGPDREKGYRPPKFCSQGSCEALGWVSESCHLKIIVIY